MLKQLVILFLCFIVLQGCKQHKNSTFTITGKVINANNAVVKLVSFVNDSNLTIVDTTITSKNGNFKLNTFANTEALFAIKVNQLPYIFIANDGNELEITIDAKQYNNYTVKKSPNSQSIKDYFVEYQKFENKIQKAKDSIVKSKKNNISDSLLNTLKQQEQTAINTLKTFCASSINKANGVALKYITILYGFKTNNINNEQAAMYIAEAALEFKGSNQIQELKNYITEIVALHPETVLLNKAMIPFSLVDTNGDTINTKNYFGKYVLIDFWTSYNKVYKSEVNQLTQTYKEFKDTNFTIIGICLDSNFKTAYKTIKNDSLKWKHHIDTSGLKSSIAKKYYVNNVPFNVLISPQQKIIAVNLRGYTLKEKLKALYQR